MHRLLKSAWTAKSQIWINASFNSTSNYPKYHGYLVITYLIFTTITSIVGTCSNGWFLWRIFWQRLNSALKLRYIFIGNLVVCDFLNCFFVMPLQMKGLIYNYFHMPYLWSTCVFKAVMTTMVRFMSECALASIAVERYSSIKDSLSAKQSINGCKRILSIVTCWFLGFLRSFVVIYLYGLIDIEELYICEEELLKYPQLLFFITLLEYILGIVIIGVCLGLIILCYVLSYFIVWRHNKVKSTQYDRTRLSTHSSLNNIPSTSSHSQSDLDDALNHTSRTHSLQRNKSQAKDTSHQVIAKRATGLIVVYFSSFMPMFIFVSIVPKHEIFLYSNTNLLLLLCLQISPFMHPILYIATQSQWKEQARKDVKNFIRCLKCFK